MNSQSIKRFMTMEKNIDLKDIIRFLDNSLIAVYGEPESVVIRHLRDPEHVDEYTLDWINPLKPDKQKNRRNIKSKSDRCRQRSSILRNLEKSRKSFAGGRQSKISHCQSRE